MSTISSIMYSLVISAILLAAVVSPGLVLADEALDDHGHDEEATATATTGLARLLENRLIYLVGSIIMMTGLTWGVFAVTRKKEIKSPSDNPVS